MNHNHWCGHGGCSDRFYGRYHEHPYWMAPAFPKTSHQPISAALKIKIDHKLADTDIAQGLVKTTIRGTDIPSDPSKYKPTTKETADHSLPCCIAAALVDGQVLPSSFDEAKLKKTRASWPCSAKSK